MSNENVAVIQFIGYRVTNILYNCDPSFELPQGEVALIAEASTTICFNKYNKFNFSKSLAILSDTEVQENVCANVFYCTTDNIEEAPFRITVEIAGRFRCDNEWKPELEPNVLAIMFPYLRSIISTITCNSGREPIILPTINIASLFEK